MGVLKLDLKQAEQLMRQGVMIKHPHCNGRLLMENGSIEMHCMDGRRLTLGTPYEVTLILSNVMSDDWDIVTMEDVKMDQRDVNKIVGRFPDRITSAKTLTARVWLCSECGKAEDGPYTPNKPCGCGSIFWQGFNKE